MTATLTQDSQAPETVESIAEDITQQVSPVVEFISSTSERFAKQFFTTDGLIGFAIIIMAATLAWFLAKPIRQRLAQIWMQDQRRSKSYRYTFQSVILRIIFPSVFVLILWLSVPILQSADIANDMIRVLASILQAWIVINLFSSVVRDHLWSRTFAASAWIIAVLYILRLLDPMIAFLESISIHFGESQLSLFDITKGGIILFLLIWAALTFLRLLQIQLDRSQLTPSMRSLMSQLARILTLFLAVTFGLNIIGVDLTALAVFSGAIGVGVGIGLQQIVSNLMSGVTLHIEGTIKEGDFVELSSGIRGEVKKISTRATQITTNDAVDILVPNSEFINNATINLTLREDYCRIRIPFGVAYGSDKELVKKAVLEAAATLPHGLSGPNAKPPEVWLTQFGESSLDFKLVIWVNNAAVKRPDAVVADYNWAIETALRKYNIEIPFPQRDLHIRSSAWPLPQNASSITDQNPAQIL